MAKPEDVDNPSRSPNVDGDIEMEDYDIPDSPLGATQYGTTAAEEAIPESLEERIRRESPDELGADTRRPQGMGRLVEDNEGMVDVTAEEMAYDLGEDGGDFSAEEAAMHEVTEPE